MTEKGVLGLDIGSSSVKALEIHRNSKGYELSKFGMAVVPHDAIVQGEFLDTNGIIESIREAISISGSSLKSVATAVSGHAVIVKRISLPKMNRAELEESLTWEAEQYIPFDVSEVNLDFQILDKDSGGGADDVMEVLLVAVKKDLIDHYTQVITEAGLEPKIIEVAGFSVQNAFEANHPNAMNDGAIALVNIGAQTVNINVVINGYPAFTRDIASGGGQYTAEIQKALSIGFDEAEGMKRGEKSLSGASQDVIPQEVEHAMRGVTDVLIGEIMRSLDFFSATSDGNRVKRIVLSGGSSKVVGFKSVFQERVDVPVDVLDPIARVTPGKNLDSEYLSELSPMLGVGVGLALRRVQ